MDRRIEGSLWITLQGGSDGVGRSEVPTDSGADPGAVEGASTFMGPERTTGLRTHPHTEEMKNIRQEPQGPVSNISSVSCDPPQSCRLSGWRSASSPAAWRPSSLTRFSARVSLRGNTPPSSTVTRPSPRHSGCVGTSHNLCVLSEN